MTSLNCGWLFVMAVKILQVAMITITKLKIFKFILVVVDLTVQKCCFTSDQSSSAVMDHLWWSCEQERFHFYDSSTRSTWKSI